MVDINTEPIVAQFKESDPDHYLLVSEEDIALEAAWTVLQAFELTQIGELRFYTDGSKDATLENLREGGEERPASGIFAVELQRPDSTEGRVKILISNRNGIGDVNYRGVLRLAVQSVGIEPPQD